MALAARHRMPQPPQLLILEGLLRFVSQPLAASSPSQLSWLLSLHTHWYTSVLVSMQFWSAALPGMSKQELPQVPQKRGSSKATQAPPQHMKPASQAAPVPHAHDPSMQLSAAGRLAGRSSLQSDPQAPQFASSSSSSQPVAQHRDPSQGALLL